MFRYVGLQQHYKRFITIINNRVLNFPKLLRSTTNLNALFKQFEDDWYVNKIQKETKVTEKQTDLLYFNFKDSHFVPKNEVAQIKINISSCYRLKVWTKENIVYCVRNQRRAYATGKNVKGETRKGSFFEWIRKYFEKKPKDKKNKNESALKIKNNQGTKKEDKKEELEKLRLAFTDGYIAAAKHLNTQKSSKWIRIFSPILSVFVISGVIVCLMIIISGTLFRAQLSKYTEINAEDIHVSFRDVKGAQEAKQELKEIVEFLRSPEKFSILGGKLPKGVLLVGPPGTGKTLLARAVAGEARVPFFHVAGPEFDEVLVGQGARRVRDLFKAAKEAAPCVIFIDEIDSVGSKRTNSMLHPYANQTINQLLSEMDGFHQNEGVIVLGATNRREDLDKALLRPGRFDIEVVVPIPDYTERKEILEYYLSKILCENIDIDLLARGTVGFTGADLENMVNQAALKATIEGSDSVTMMYLDGAKDKILMGPEKKSRILDDETNLITAYHEGGHTIVCFYTKDSKPLHKVTILPRGRSLGHTAYLPEKEQYVVKKSQLLATMDTLMGGRAAEELIFGPDKITTGASSDLREATNIATHMVKEWGMSEKVGLRTVDSNQSTSEVVDAEISRLLQESYKRAKNIIKNYSRELKLLVEALLKYETLDADDVKAILMQRRQN